MKYVKNLFIGVFLTLIGVGMFLQRLTFSDPSNTGLLGDVFGALFGNTSPKAVTGILFVIIFIFILLSAFSPNAITIGGLALSLIFSILVIVGSMSIQIATMSGLELTLIVAMTLIGIGLSARSVIMLVVPNK